jgi:hypothetical protein
MRRGTHSQLGEVSAEDTRDIMGRVILLLPVKRLAILEYPVDNSWGKGRREYALVAESRRPLGGRAYACWNHLRGTYLLFRWLRRGGAHDRRFHVRDLQTDPQKNASTHHFLLRTSHYIGHNRPCPMYMNTFFSEGEKEGWTKGEGGNQGNEQDADAPFGHDNRNVTPYI